ncbi:MAG: hypothetical protein PVH58_18435 [Desulfobacterales bacterium]
MKNYDFLFTRFTDEFGDRELDTITPDEILSFLTRLTEGTKQTTKRNRYSCLKAFFNYVKNSIDLELHNPCDTPILRKIFKNSRPQQWKIVVFIPQKIADRLKDYISEKGIEPEQRIFPITYNAARVWSKKPPRRLGFI